MHLTIQDVSSFTIPMASFIRLIRTLVRQHGVCIGFYKQKCQHLHKQQDLHYKKKDNKQSSEKIIRRLFILYTTCEFIYHFLRWYINKLQPSKHRGKHFHGSWRTHHCNSTAESSTRWCLLHWRCTILAVRC